MWSEIGIHIYNNRIQCPRCAGTLDSINLIAQTTDGIAIVLIVGVETHASTGIVEIAVVHFDISVPGSTPISGVGAEMVVIAVVTAGKLRSKT